MTDVANIAPIANIVETALLVLVGLFAAVAAWRAADANRDSADAARKLNASLQEAAKPRLDFWDRFDKPRYKVATAIVDAPAIVLLRNYGGRAARIESATFEIDGIVEKAKLLTPSVVMPGDLVQFQLDWSSSELKAARWGTQQSPEDEDGRLLLRVSYSEVDGNGRVEREIRSRPVVYRPEYAPGTTIRVLGPVRSDQT